MSDIKADESEKGCPSGRPVEKVVAPYLALNLDFIVHENGKESHESITAVFEYAVNHVGISPDLIFHIYLGRPPSRTEMKNGLPVSWSLESSRDQLYNIARVFDAGYALHDGDARRLLDALSEGYDEDPEEDFSILGMMTTPPGLARAAALLEDQASPGFPALVH